MRPRLGGWVGGGGPPMRENQHMMLQVHSSEIGEARGWAGESGAKQGPTCQSGGAQTLWLQSFWKPWRSQYSWAAQSGPDSWAPWGVEWFAEGHPLKQTEPLRSLRPLIRPVGTGLCGILSRPSGGGERVVPVISTLLHPSSEKITFHSPPPQLPPTHLSHLQTLEQGSWTQNGHRVY